MHEMFQDVGARLLRRSAMPRCRFVARRAGSVPVWQAAPRRSKTALTGTGICDSEGEPRWVISPSTHENFPASKSTPTSTYTGNEVLLYHRIQNISLGGVCIQSSGVEDVGTMVDLVINFPDLDASIAVKGEVVWVNREAPDGHGHPLHRPRRGAQGDAAQVHRHGPQDLARADAR